MAKARTKTKSKVIKKSGAETNLVRRVTMKEMAKSIPTFHPGDTVGVYVKVKEGEKERVQLYKGLVTKIQGSGVARSFTVRKVSAGVGVERTFPFRSPALDKIEVVSTGKVRRAKLYYLRDLDGKAAKIESELVNQEESAEAPAKTEAANAEAKA